MRLDLGVFGREKILHEIVHGWVLCGRRLAVGAHVQAAIEIPGRAQRRGTKNHSAVSSAKEASARSSSSKTAKPPRHAYKHTHQPLGSGSARRASCSEARSAAVTLAAVRSAMRAGGAT